MKDILSYYEVEDAEEKHVQDLIQHLPKVKRKTNVFEIKYIFNGKSHRFISISFFYYYYVFVSLCCRDMMLKSKFLIYILPCFYI